MSVPMSACDRREHQAMPLDAALAAKRLGDEPHAEVPAFARAGMTGVPRAVVVDVELQRRELAFERRADAADAFGSHVRPASDEVPRLPPQEPRDCAAVNTNVATVSPNTLNFTHVASLVLNATSRFTAPSSA